MPTQGHQHLWCHLCSNTSWRMSEVEIHGCKYAPPKPHQDVLSSKIGVEAPVAPFTPCQPASDARTLRTSDPMHSWMLSTRTVVVLWAGCLWVPTKCLGVNQFKGINMKWVGLKTIHSVWGSNQSWPRRWRSMELRWQGQPRICTKLVHVADGRTICNGTYYEKFNMWYPDSTYTMWMVQVY